MPIPDAETRAIKEEIEKALMVEAFVKLATAFARKDLKLYLATARSIHEASLSFPVRKFFPPANVKIDVADLKYLQESGLRDAVATLETAIRKALS